MKNPLKYIIGIPLVIVAGYFASFFILGWLAPHNMAINRFYSEQFYSLRCAYESNYINRLERYDGILRFTRSGDPIVVKDQKPSTGFLVPESLKDAIYGMPDGSEVEIYVGKRLDRESVGIYHHELRSIKKKGA